MLLFGVQRERACWDVVRICESEKETLHAVVTLNAVALIHLFPFPLTRFPLPRREAAENVSGTKPVYVLL
jgi:hypothetical protein